MNIRNIALNKLVMSKANVRKTDVTDGIAEMADSIAAHWLRKNLNARAGEKRRF